MAPSHLETGYFNMASFLRPHALGVCVTERLTLRLVFDIRAILLRSERPPCFTRAGVQRLTPHPLEEVILSPGKPRGAAIWRILGSMRRANICKAPSVLPAKFAGSPANEADQQAAENKG